MTPKQNISMSFASGVDTKTDEYQIAPGQLSILENASFNKLKAVAKRTGHDQVVADLTLAHGVGIGHYRGQTLTCDGSRLYRVHGSAHQDLGGVSVPFQLNQFPVISAPQVFNAATSASSSYVCTAVEIQTGVQVVVQDSTGALVYTYSFPGTSRPQMLYFSGMSKHVLGVRDAVNGVRLYVLDPANKSYQTQWIDQNAQGQFSIWADSSHIYVAVALLHTVFLERFYVNNGILYPQDVVTETTALVDFPKLVTGCQLDSDKSLMVWIESNNTVFFAIAQNGSLIQSKSAIFFATDLRNVAAVYDGTTAHIYLDVMQTDTWMLWHMVVRSDHKAIVSNTVIGSAASLAAKPFVTGGRVVVPAISRPEGQRRYFLLDGNSPQVLSRFDDLTLDAPAQGCLSALSTVGTKTYLCQPLEANAGNTVAVGVADTALGTFYGQEIASGFYFLLGSRMHLFDGGCVSEVGFDLSPDRVILPSATGSTYTYNYSVVWAWTDAQGLVHESSPSPLCTMQTATPIGPGASAVALEIPVYPLPTMKGDVQCRLYRTPNNGDATTLRLCAKRLVSNAISIGQATINHTDSLSDALLEGSTAFGASLPNPDPCQLAPQQRGIVPPALAGATLTEGGSIPVGVNRYYVITALSPFGETQKSYEVAGSHITLSGPPAKRSFTVVWSSHSVASGYRLYRADSPGGPYRLLIELGENETQYLDDGSVITQDQAPPDANSTASGSFAGATPLAIPSNVVATHYDPAVPGSLTGSPTWRVTAINARGETMASIGVGGLSWWTLFNESVDISWDAVSGATSYKVYRGPGDNVGLEGYIATVSAPTTTFRDDGSLTPGSACPTSDKSADGSGTVSTQYYRVSATNETGETLASTEVSIALTYSDTPCGILVTWARIPGASKYRVYGRATGTEQFLIETVETSWLDKNVETPSGTLPVANTTGPRPYSGGEFIYTYNGTVPNQPPPPTCFLAEHQRRLFGICSTNKKRIWYSQPSTKGYPLETNPLIYYLDLPEATGDCVGVAGTQDKLAIFMSNSILWTMGDGADELGQGGYAVPQPLTSDVGLKDPRSIVATPRGLCFRSAKGIYAMGLAMEGVTYLGAPAEDLWLSTDVVRAACLSALDNEVRWYLPGDRGTETARAIVWHYLVNQFSLHRILSFGVTDAKTNPITGLVEMVGPFGQVCRANRTSYTDVGTSYSRKIRTGWLALGEISGYGRLHRLMLLAKWLSAHNLEVTLEFDRETNSETVIIPAQSTMTPELFEINPKTHRCESIRITITDDGAAASCSLSALTFAVSLKPGFKRLGAAQKFAAE